MRTAAVIVACAIGCAATQAADPDPSARTGPIREVKGCDEQSYSRFYGDKTSEASRIHREAEAQHPTDGRDAYRAGLEVADRKGLRVMVALMFANYRFHSRRYEEAEAIATDVVDDHASTADQRCQACELLLFIDEIRFASAKAPGPPRPLCQ